MSTVELINTKTISIRRKEITEIDTKLRAINEQFPGQRKMASRLRDRAFVELRNSPEVKGLIERRRFLSAQQSWARLQLKGGV
jgi:hypothetical protein